MKPKIQDPEWDKALEEIKVLQNRLNALQGIVVKKIEAQQQKWLK
jgi:hypothetical protein